VERDEVAAVVREVRDLVDVVVLRRADETGPHLPRADCIDHAVLGAQKDGLERRALEDAHAAARAAVVVDRAPLPIPPTQDERLVSRPRVQEIAAIALFAEFQEGPRVVERDREAAQRALQLGQRDAFAPRVELLENPAERGRHGPPEGNRSIGRTLR